MGTVAGMKGETHVASLVLESYGGRSRRFDIETALPVISGIESGFKKLSKLQQEQMRNLYVAMSRPTKLLCLAANEERVPQPVIDALEVKGWIIERVT
jgi:DNA helicase-2/ATP-dependent DNA helicase PcrA